MDSKTNQRAKAPKAWIREGTDEEPVDFLDPKVVQRVVGKSLLSFYFTVVCRTSRHLDGSETDNGLFC